MNRTICIVVPMGLALAGCAGFGERLPWPLGDQTSAANLPSVAPLAESEIAAALRDALAQGVGTAISTLGRSNGYWGNAAVRVPLPKGLARAEPTLRKLGMGAQVDEFHLTLNRAAEQAVPQAASLFADAVRAMSLDDARTILHGGEDAATQYFRRTTGAALEARVRPYVEEATRRNGVTQRYKALMNDYGALLQRAGVEAVDLDAHVTAKAVDGLFYAIAAEEARIRRDPRARTTELMRRVFGAP